MTQLMTAERVGPAETRVPELEKPSPVPAWVPDGTDLEYVPDRVKQSMREIVQPLYDRLVVEARHPLDRSLGMTLAHMTWLEILDEEDHRREYTEILSVLKLAQNRESKIQHHVRMLEAKIRVGKFLLQLEETRRRWDREDERDRPAAPSPCGPPARANCEVEPPACDRPSALASYRVVGPEERTLDPGAWAARRAAQPGPEPAPAETASQQPHGNEPADSPDDEPRAHETHSFGDETSENAPVGAHNSPSDGADDPPNEQPGAHETPRFRVGTKVLNASGSSVGAPARERDSAGHSEGRNASKEAFPRGSVGTRGQSVGTRGQSVGTRGDETHTFGDEKPENAPVGAHNCPSDGADDPQNDELGAHHADRKRLRRVREMIQARPALFAQQGAVVVVRRSRRRGHAKTYYRLVWREGGRRKGFYLGRSEALADAVRALLDDAKRPGRERRAVREAKVLAKAALKRDQQNAVVREVLGILGQACRGTKAQPAFDRLADAFSRIPPSDYYKYADTVDGCVDKIITAFKAADRREREAAAAGGTGSVV